MEFNSNKDTNSPPVYLDLCVCFLLRLLSIQISALNVTAPANVRLVANLLSVGAILYQSIHYKIYCDAYTVLVRLSQTILRRP